MKFTEGRLGRIFVLRLEDNDRLPDILETFAVNKEISCALIFLLGGVKGRGKIIAGPSKEDKNTISPLIQVLRGVHEVCGVGTIIPDEKGQPKAHIHASFGRDENVTMGCIRLGIHIWRIAEMILLEILDIHSMRKKDRITGLEFLEVT